MTKELIFKIKKLREDAIIPTKAYDHAAAFDLYSCEDKNLEPGEKYVFKTGIATIIPKGYCVVFKDRSGLAAKHGLHCLAGLIDEDYRGEYGVVMINLGKESVSIKKGERICQAMILPVPKISIEEIEDFGEEAKTARGEGGFGSSGKF